MALFFRINNQIRSKELRVIDEDGNNLGVLSFGDALEKARNQELDLIEISPMAVPPVAKIMEYGKFLYMEQKKQKGAKGHTTETKSLQIKIGTGDSDLERKAKKTSEFLKEGHRVKIDLFLPGRTKYFDIKFLNERLERILNLVTENYKIAEAPKRGPKGLTVTLERSKEKPKDDFVPTPSKPESPENPTQEPVKKP